MNSFKKGPSRILTPDPPACFSTDRGLLKISSDSFSARSWILPTARMELPFRYPSEANSPDLAMLAVLYLLCFVRENRSKLFKLKLFKIFKYPFTFVYYLLMFTVSSLKFAYLFIAHRYKNSPPKRRVPSLGLRTTWVRQHLPGSYQYSTAATKRNMNRTKQQLKDLKT